MEGGDQGWRGAMKTHAREAFGERLHKRLRALYANEYFNLGIFLFDITTILLFLVLTFAPHQAPWTVIVDIVIGLLMLTELLARWWASERSPAFFRRPYELIDLVIILSLLIPPLTGSFAFLRVLRAMRLFRALRLISEQKQRHRWMVERGELIQSSANLILFIFVTSSIVYEAQTDINPAIQTILDALYFTVTTLTTTGFGDVTLVGTSGRLLSAIIMIVGVSLFLKLAQSIIRPSKVHVTCRRCGLSRHDPDAVYCKHCGEVVYIPNEGN